jgi:hypothetical protein
MDTLHRSIHLDNGVIEQRLVDGRHAEDRIRYRQPEPGLPGDPRCQLFDVHPNTIANICQMRF